MPIAIGSKAFDPAAHLEKQGWKGKGTALKNGHLTRPLAVVHKKCLGGVGKNRDEQVPFWDNIFAATAASLSLPSSGTSTPTTSASPHGVKLADPRINKLGSWQTSGSAEASSSLTNKGKGQAGLSIATRVAQENARRGLYSKFFRGETLRSGGEDTDDGAGKGGAAKVETVMITASASTPTLSLNSTSGSASTSASSPAPIAISTSSTVEETKEERRARRAAKAERKLEKANRKAEKEVKREAKAKRKAEKEELEQQQERADIVNETRGTSAPEKPSEDASGELPRIAHAIAGHATVDETDKAEVEDKEDERARKKRRKEEKRAKKDKA